MTLSTKPPKASFWHFFLPSLVGILFFMIPFKYEDRRAILLAHLSTKCCQYFETAMPYIIAGALVLSALLSTTATLWRPHWLISKRSLSPCVTSRYWLVGRLVGASLALLIITQQGPKYLWDQETGHQVLYSLLPVLFTNLLLSSLLAPFLLKFGLLEFIGTFMTPIMRPLFLLPGRAAVNCVTAWIGDGTVGTMMAVQEHKQGGYTEKEASIVITCFSAVSITFYPTILAQVNLEEYFGPFCFTTLFTSLIIALILPRIPPLSRKQVQYTRAHTSPKPRRATTTRWQQGLDAALERAAHAPSPLMLLKQAIQNVFGIIIIVLPSVMVISSCSLILAHQYPFLFLFFGKPFVPLLECLHLPKAIEASQSLLVGFADMFIPSVLAGKELPQITRFTIACLSVTQVLYLSELGALLFGGHSKLRISLAELFILFLQRTLISLPVIACCAHFFFN